MAGAEAWDESGKRVNIADNFPLFTIVHLDEDDILVGCPKAVGKRCGHQFVVHGPTWYNMPQFNLHDQLPNMEANSGIPRKRSETRSCPYCGRASRVPLIQMFET